MRSEPPTARQLTVPGQLPREGLTVTAPADRRAAQRHERRLATRAPAAGPPGVVGVGRRAEDGVRALEREERLRHTRLAERDAAARAEELDELGSAGTLYLLAGRRGGGTATHAEDGGRCTGAEGRALLPGTAPPGRAKPQSTHVRLLLRVRSRVEAVRRAAERGVDADNVVCV